MYDDGSAWVLGHAFGVPETLGYFPKDYVVPMEEYQEPLNREFFMEFPEMFHETWVLYIITVPIG